MIKLIHPQILTKIKETNEEKDREIQSSQRVRRLGAWSQHFMFLILIFESQKFFSFLIINIVENMHIRLYIFNTRQRVN